MNRKVPLSILEALETLKSEDEHGQCHESAGEIYTVILNLLKESFISSTNGRHIMF